MCCKASNRGMDVWINILRNRYQQTFEMYWTYGPPAMKWLGQKKIKKIETMQIHRAQFPGKVRGIFHVDSIMALNSLPIGDYHGVWRGGQKNENTRNIRQNSDSSAVCCVLPECLQLLGKLNDCTAGEWRTGLPQNPPVDSTFFVLNIHGTLTVSLTNQL